LGVKRLQRKARRGLGIALYIPKRCYSDITPVKHVWRFCRCEQQKTSSERRRFLDYLKNE
jgi:hypothetical protein